MGHLLGCTGGDQLTTFRACLGAKVENPVGIFEHIHVVFDDEKGCPLVDEAVKQPNQEGDIVQVKAGGGLIEDEEGGVIRFKRTFLSTRFWGVGLVVLRG